MPKHSELNRTRKYQIGDKPRHATKAPHAKEYLMERPAPVFNEEAYEARCDFRYSPSFKGYTRMIESMLKRAGRALTIREIHVLLGVEANPRWTADALEMSNHIIILLGYIDKYLWFDGKINIDKKQWNGFQITPPKPKTPDLGLPEVRV